ncbi:MAG: AbrB family transcriptional regulator [Paracoccaceae bacterium]|nr:AbrB family transcriptional regulator [Paracoccaceae bacterium]
MIFSRFVLSFGLFIAAFFGAILAYKIGLPMPFMMGSLITTATIIAIFPKIFPDKYAFAPRLRTVVLTIIGVAIGSQITPEIVARAPEIAISLLGVVLFVPIAHFVNYMILRRLAGYPRYDALFAGAPGGFIESITLAEEYGADVKRVGIQHFLRVVFVIFLVPIILTLYLGNPIGVARADVFVIDLVPPVQIALIANVALFGFLIARALKIPAGMLIGPLVIAAIISGFNGPSLDVPTWVVAFGQIIVGTSLGIRFQGLKGKLLLKSAWWCLVTVSATLVLSATFSQILYGVSGQSFETLLISFAPGGLTEMGLIALSLSANSAVVVFHHLVRIIMTVMQLTLFIRFRGI